MHSHTPPCTLLKLRLLLLPIPLQLHLILVVVQLCRIKPKRRPRRCRRCRRTPGDSGRLPSLLHLRLRLPLSLLARRLLSIPRWHTDQPHTHTHPARSSSSGQMSLQLRIPW